MSAPIINTMSAHTSNANILREHASLEKLKTRRTFSDYWQRVAVSEKLPLPKIPDHWRKQDYNVDRVVQRIDDHPMGYPRLASFLNSDDNFLICRRFGVLHNRVMLYRQDELDQLEAHLMALDAEDADEDPRALMSRKRDDRREGACRRELIMEIDEKLKAYGSPIPTIRAVPCNS
ncbi:hypothetical protein LTR28_005293 [Elasticomyces elasticus]|nr:hypothetical protein LTR28_005293 [Elasticomyces elasticus]